MRLFTAVPLVAAITISRIAGAQSCALSGRPIFEYQAAKPAVFVGDSALRPRPANQHEQRQDASALIVSFIVDTLGVPDGRTLKILQTPSKAAADSVQTAIGSWRFTPAVVATCRVAQVFMTTVVH
jgi:hypothetical protein